MNNNRTFRFSIKYKFSIFLIFLLLLLVGAICFFILNKISVFQKTTQEETLLKQLNKANILIKQDYLTSNTSLPIDEYIERRATTLIALITDMCEFRTAIYDLSGKNLASKISLSNLTKEEISTLLEFTKEGKKSYIYFGDNIYFASPFKVLSENSGIILFEYPIKNDLEFYKNIRKSLIAISIILLIISLIIGVLYYHKFVNLIIKLKSHIELIGNSDYSTPIFKRNDELGDLSLGIYEMGAKIEENIKKITNEKNNLSLAVEKLELLGMKQNLFIGSITHEFKTPLTSIIVYSDLLEIHQNDQELLLEAKTNIKKESGRLLQMVEEVLKLQSLQKYSFEFQPENINIKDLIEDVLNRIRWKANKYGISIKTDIQSELVFLDKNALIQIFMNLIDNSIKYNNMGGIIIIKSQLTDEKIQIYIKDTGVGISSDSQALIFEPFFTANKDRSRITGGTGLGLSIVKQLVESQSGSITLVQSSSKGSEFMVEFPCKR